MFDEWVESGGGFVKDEDIDVGGEGGDEHDFLPVAFGVGADFFGGVEFESFNVFGAFFLLSLVGRSLARVSRTWLPVRLGKSSTSPGT